MDVPSVIKAGSGNTIDLISFQYNLTKIVTKDIYLGNKIENEKRKPRKKDPNVLDLKVNKISIIVPQI